MEADLTKLKSLIDGAQSIIIMQADNPDGDSLGTSLALEQILGDLGKEPYLYCGVDIPIHLRYLSGWDRVHKDLPTQFDLSIIVDTSADGLFDNLEKSGQKSWVAARPCIVIDHHDVDANIPFATIVWCKTAVATGEVVYDLATEFKWSLNLAAKEMIAVSIMSDSLGLTSEGTTAHSMHVMADLVESGVSIAKIESARRELMRKSPELIRYKGQLLQRIEYFDEGRVATITIPWEEIERWSHMYNPSMLVMDEMRMSEKADVAIAFKTYPDGKITAKIRSNYGKGIAGDLGKHFGGGGHAYAAGFKILGGKQLNEVRNECIEVASKLLDKISNQ